MSEKEDTIYTIIANKRKKTFSDWKTAYNTIKTELESLILSIDDIKTIPNPQFQDLTLKFYCIHLCNFFYFHVRKVLVTRNSGTDIEKLLTNGFSNTSNTPSESVMNDILSYLITEEEKLSKLKEEYKKIRELRHKYAHGDSAGTSFSITTDEFKSIYNDISTLS